MAWKEKGVKKKTGFEDVVNMRASIKKGRRMWPYSNRRFKQLKTEEDIWGWALIVRGCGESRKGRDPQPGDHLTVGKYMIAS